MEIFENFLQYLRLVTVTDVIDILIVAALLYKLIKFMRNTSTARLLKGILFLLIAMQLSDWFKLHV
ncbi:MAG: TIGR00159 family protein, partial [Angelakisella sp.]